MAMMDELVRHVAAKAGIPEDKARVAMQSGAEFMADRLPPQYGAVLRQFSTTGDLPGGAGGAGGAGGGLGGLGGLAGGLGGMFGGGKS